MSKVKPVFRVFDHDKAIAFYVNWLGFKIDWENDPGNAPFYLQISLRDVVLNLSEHHNDGCPSSHAAIEHFTDLRAYHQILLDTNDKYNRPTLETPEWDSKAITMTVTDPFGNQLTFSESI